VNSTVDPSFAAEIARTLRDEIGARSLYGRLSRGERDPELARLLQAFALEGDGIERSLRGLQRELATGGRDTSVVRSVAAHAWGLSARLGLRRIVLRLCVESEEVLARRYAGFAHALARAGRIAGARECEGLATLKSTRAGALRAWVPH